MVGTSFIDSFSFWSVCRFQIYDLNEKKKKYKCVWYAFVKYKSPNVKVHKNFWFCFCQRISIFLKICTLLLFQFWGRRCHWPLDLYSSSSLLLSYFMHINFWLLYSSRLVVTKVSSRSSMPLLIWIMKTQLNLFFLSSLIPLLTSKWISQMLTKFHFKFIDTQSRYIWVYPIQNFFVSSWTTGHWLSFIFFFYERIIW